MEILVNVIATELLRESLASLTRTHMYMMEIHHVCIMCCLVGLADAVPLVDFGDQLGRVWVFMRRTIRNWDVPLLGGVV